MINVASAPETLPGRWPAERINAWYAQQAWPVGANYAPRTAINQLEMWQADTFDPQTIEQELGWAAAIGMNTMRVFLHDILWRDDAPGLLARMETFLQIADRHGIKTLFVFFDSCWDPHPYAGRQRPPRPHVHNSGWLQSPGRVILADPARHAPLQAYVQGVLRHFRDDARILGWDLFNEPDNANTDAYRGLDLPDKGTIALVLLRQAFAWARAVAPSQPLTTGIWMSYTGWKLNPPINQFTLANADFISFHNYAVPAEMMLEATELQALGRPVVCTEYMGRPTGSTFDPILGQLKQARVGAINWGLVDGKIQTSYPWDSWTKVYTAEPELWHHDIFRSDGTPYRQNEVDYIRALTQR